MTADAPGNDAFETALQRDLPRGRDRPPRTIGLDRVVTSHWLSPDEMVGPDWDAKNGLLLGRRSGRIIGWNDDRHLLTIAGSRAGKGVSLIIPNLIHYKGSAVVIDPKGENAARTAGRRGTGPKNGAPGLGQNVFVLDPFGESGIPSSSFNPLAKLKPDRPEIIEHINVFADALIIHEEKGERHWTESAQAVIRALILCVLVDRRFEKRRNLVTVRRLVALTDPAIADARNLPNDVLLSTEDALIRILMAQEGTPFGHICTGMGEQLSAMGEKERGSVLSNARTQTLWLDTERMADILSSEDGKLELELNDLKRTPMTIYLCLPATHMGGYARWLRLIVLLAFGAMEREKTKADLPVLFVLDEFPVLGYMQSVEMAAGLMAGFGVKLWPIMQNVGQIKRYYEKSWETFFANAGVVTAFGVNDSETLTALSKMIGHSRITVRTESTASRSSLMQGASPINEDRRDVPLLAEHEMRQIFARRTKRVLIASAELDAAVAERFTYHKDPHFRTDDGKPLYDPDPNYEPAA